MIRNTLLGVLVALVLTACTTLTPTETPTGFTSQTPPREGFVRVEDGVFVIDGAPYRYVGVNMWYGAYVAAPGETGDIERLRAELDLLRSRGITNIRVLGASEESPLKNSVRPTFRDASDTYNEDLLTGLDILLAELGKRDMKAVIYLNNFWEWSGGMGTYLSWVNGGQYIDLGDPAHPWPAFVLFNMDFYGNEAANALFQDYITALVTRRNTVTGQLYIDDPAIMAWQLANEPRSGYSTEPGMNALPEFYNWVEETAALIRSLDPNHMISVGNEGTFGCSETPVCVLESHRFDEIDYVTVHMWPKNWSWLDEADFAGSIDRVLANSADYIGEHIALADELGKPLVLEEFGFPRDENAISPDAPTTYRDRFYTYVFGLIEESALSGGPLIGSNLWSWGGQGRAARPSGQWVNGDGSFTGDPPQEPQGLNSVFDTDTSTLNVMEAHASRLN